MWRGYLSPMLFNTSGAEAAVAKLIRFCAAHPPAVNSNEDTQTLRERRKASARIEWKLPQRQGMPALQAIRHLRPQLHRWRSMRGRTPARPCVVSSATRSVMASRVLRSVYLVSAPISSKLQNLQRMIRTDRHRAHSTSKLGLPRDLGGQEGGPADRLPVSRPAPHR
jgi:hypothetical protein